MLDEDGEWEDEETEVMEMCCPFMDYKCWQYINTWIVRPDDSSKSLEHELYDIFSKHMHHGDGISPLLDYGIMSHTWGQSQDSFLQNCSVTTALQELCLDTAPNTAAAVSQGLRKEDLASALFADFQTWTFESPDWYGCWPYKSDSHSEIPIFRSFEVTTNSRPMLLVLPLELLLLILFPLSLTDIIRASSASKSMRQLLTSPGILPLLLRNMVLNPTGALRWIQPCSLVEGEVDKAHEALRTWVIRDVDEQCSPLYTIDFPFVDFVRTCLVESASMKSRRRIWGMIKQVEVLLAQR
ncbi:hypothetical protein DL96DRAFT_1607638 [Flagelloscypha sp. PMI_526]|nr:hypothetical protein DL96DRAFT_1607638 [Flagelloscypha sp. PMI_526]